MAMYMQYQGDMHSGCIYRSSTCRYHRVRSQFLAIVCLRTAAWGSHSGWQLTTATFPASLTYALLSSSSSGGHSGSAYIVMLLAIYFICIFIGAGLGKFVCDWMIKTVVVVRGGASSSKRAGRAALCGSACPLLGEDRGTGHGGRLGAGMGAASLPVIAPKTTPYPSENLVRGLRLACDALFPSPLHRISVILTRLYAFPPFPLDRATRGP